MIEDSRRMKGILQQFDVEARSGYEKAEQDARDRSKSLGRSEGARSERNNSPNPLLGRQVPVLGVQGVESQPFLQRGMNDSF